MGNKSSAIDTKQSTHPMFDRRQWTGIVGYFFIKTVVYELCISCQEKGKKTVSFLYSLVLKFSCSNISDCVRCETGDFGFDSFAKLA